MRRRPSSAGGGAPCCRVDAGGCRRCGCAGLARREAHFRHEPNRLGAGAGVIHDGHTQINGGTAQQRALLSSILLGISSKDVPEVTITPHSPVAGMKAGTWLVFHFSTSNATSTLGEWQSALVAGAFHDFSQQRDLPSVGGWGQLFQPRPGSKPQVGSNYRVFSTAAGHGPIQRPSAAALTDRIRSNARRQGITIVSIRFAKPGGLAPIVIARTSDPHATLGEWQPQSTPIPNDSRLEGSFYEVINAAGRTVFDLGRSTRTQSVISNGGDAPYRALQAQLQMGRISGSILTEGGIAIAGADRTPVRNAPVVVTGTTKDGKVISRAPTTDRDGHFTVDVPAGTYTIEPPIYPNASVRVVVTAGAVAHSALVVHVQ